MKSRYCPLLYLHSDDVDRENDERGYAKSSSIRYSPNNFKSHRRRDPVVDDEYLELLKLKNKVKFTNSTNECTSC